MATGASAYGRHLRDHPGLSQVGDVRAHQPDATIGGLGRGQPRRRRRSWLAGRFRRFIRIANGSVCELEALVLVAISVPELSPFVPSDLSDELAQIKRMLYRLEGSFEAPANR